MINKNLDSIEKMSAYVTHEINTPLTYLKARLELMGYDIDTMESSSLKREFVESKRKMQEAIKRIEDVVNVVHSVTKEIDTKK